MEGLSQSVLWRVCCESLLPGTSAVRLKIPQRLTKSTPSGNGFCENSLPLHLMWGQQRQTQTEVFLVVSQPGDIEKGGEEGIIEKGAFGIVSLR